MALAHFETINDLYLLIAPFKLFIGNYVRHTQDSFSRESGQHFRDH
jgi:hypothetical protein